MTMTQEQIKEVWTRKVELQTALTALANVPENKRAIAELKEAIDSCNTELVSVTYNPPVVAD